MKDIRNILKKHILACYIILGIMAIPFLSSCTEEGVDVNDITKQTIIIYMPWTESTSLQSAFRNNLDSIKTAISSAKGMSNSRLMVFYSSSASESRLYEITWAKNTGCVENIVKEYSTPVYTTAEGIEDIINETKNAAPALNYAMIIGGHGTGWTYKDDWEDYPNNAKVMYYDTRFIGSTECNDYTTDIETLSEAICNSGTKMQYILFDNCYMANIEVAYELKDATNFLVASTSEINIAGMPYKSMWSYLCTATPNYASMTSAFYSFYSSYSCPYGSLSAIDCREVDELADVMKEINQEVSLDKTLLDSIQTTDGFNTHIFYDMSDYVGKLNPSKALLNRYNSAFSNIMRSTKYTSQFYSYLYGKASYIDIDAHCGITISDPSENSVALKGKEKTAWWKATH